MAMSEHGSSEQRDAMEARWSAWAGPAQSVLEVRGAVLDEEPPRVTLGRAGVDDPEQQVTVALGRDDGPATYLVDAQSVRLSVREAAQTLYVNGPEMSGARAAVLDGLEQSERAAGRTPADRAPAVGEWSPVVKETITVTQARSLISERAEAASDGTSRREDLKQAVAGIEQEFRVVPDPRIHAHEEQRLRKRDGVREGRALADRAGADRSREGHGLRDGEFQVQADAILDRVDPVLDELFQGIKVDVTLRESAGKTVATISDAEDGSDRRVVATPRDDGSLDYRTKDGNPLAFDHEIADLLGLSTKDTGDMLRGLESGYRDASAAMLAHRGDGAARQPSPTPEPAPEQTSVRARNAERMARQVPAGIRAEEPGESLRRAAPRPSR